VKDANLAEADAVLALVAVVGKGDGKSARAMRAGGWEVVTGVSGRLPTPGG
jgi:hypothetical protein